MATYLLLWNPKKWPWNNLQECIEDVKAKGYHPDRWSTGITKKIKPDDRVFLMKSGDEPRGIIASGWATSEVYEDEHWDKSKRTKGETAFHIDVHFDTLLDPDKKIFSVKQLEEGIYTKKNWRPQKSGTIIPDDVAAELEKDWAKFLNYPAPFKPVALAEEVDAYKTFSEGTTRKITVNAYERSAEARTICINKHGLNCSVCGFNFKKTYGEIGEDFIHVHHLRPLAGIGEEYKLNPLKDLRPVCPNCHAMLHKKKPAYSIEELKYIIEKAAE